MSDEARLPYESSDSRLPQAVPISFGRILRAKVWWILLIGITVGLSSAAAYPFIPRSYNAMALVYIQPTDQNGQPAFGHSTLNAFDESQIEAFDDLLASRPILMTVIQQHHLLQDAEFNPTLQDTWRTRLRGWMSQSSEESVDPEQLVEATVRKHLIIQRDRKSYVIKVGFWSANPVLAAAMANTLANAFVADQLGNRRDFQNDLVAQLRERTLELFRKYLDSEGKAHSYLVESGLIHRDQQESAERQLVTLSGEYAQALSRAAAAGNRAHSLTEMQRAGTLDSAPDVLGSLIIRDLKERMITLTAGVGAIGSSTGRGGASADSLADLQKMIGTEMQRIVHAAQIDAQIATLIAGNMQEEINIIDRKTIAWRDSERRLKVLQQENDADLKAWQDAMSQWRAQMNLVAVLRPDVSVYATAVAPAGPVFPNLKLYGAATLTLALLLAGLACVPAITVASNQRARRAI